MESLENMDFVSKNIGGDVGFELIAQRNFNPVWNQLLNLGDYSRVVEQVYALPRVEIEKQIDVAVRALGSAGSRTENRQVRHAELLKIGCRPAENANHCGEPPRVG
ncbi:MAG TPA: hypothetical protein VMV13_00645 [Candidatus Binataceae bacterium]|nr:hypothetical protein [Candidatus Binataceae bacterium]